MIIDAKEIHNWSDLPDAKHSLPVLIRRLILATVSNPSVLTAHGGSGVYLSGFDGEIISDGGLYIPKGKVIIELSTNSNVVAKASADYSKRTLEVTAEERKKCAYIAVTSRTWGADSKEQWLAEKAAENAWGDVRVIDANDIVQWLEIAPVVFNWFVRHIGKAPQTGLIPLADWWDQWAGATNPPIIPELMVAGRKNSQETLLTWLRAPASSFYIQGETKDEALGFFASCSLLEPRLQDIVMAKAVVVTRLESWNVLSRYNSPLILIPLFSDDFSISNAISKGHSILCCLEKGDMLNGNGVILNRTRRDLFLQALKTMGLQSDDAEAISRTTGRHLPSVRRRLLARAGGPKPVWVSQVEAQKLIPALLLGRWTENENDLSVLSKLCGRPINDILSDYRALTIVADSPLRKVGGSWRLTSHEEAWELLSPYLIRQQIESFKAIAQEVLAEDAPALELEASQRIMASFYGRVPKYSDTIKEGIATTLALMACKSEALDHSVPMVPVVVVRDMLEQGRKRWQFWASMGNLLPTLAEAAPEEVLTAIEETLQTNHCIFWDLFAEENRDSVWGSCYHSGLLWMLEKLAWTNEYFSRVCQALTKLSEIDPGGRYANRPFGSLTTLFQSWLRFSDTDDTERLAVLKYVCTTSPAIGWKLVLEILPHANSGLALRDMPYWRNWGQDYRKKPTADEFKAYNEQVIALLIEHFGTTPDQWKEIVARITHFEVNDVEVLLGKLKEATAAITDTSEWFTVRETLRRDLHLHRAHSKQKWALPAHLVAVMQEVYDLLQPTDPVKAHVWVFNHYPDLPDGSSKIDDASKDKARRLQGEKLQEIYHYGGTKSLGQLIEAAPHPALVGNIAMEVIGETPELSKYILNSLDAESWALKNFVFGTLNTLFQSNGWSKLDEYITNAKKNCVSAVGIAHIYLVPPANSDTWERLQKESADVQRAYWENLNPYGLERKNEKDFETGINYLLDYNRAEDTIQNIAYSDFKLTKETITRALELLPKNLQTLSAAGKRINIASYDIAKAFEKLDTQETDLSVISRLEMPFVTVLSHDRKHMALHKGVLSDPTLFADLITWQYKRSDGQPDAFTYSDAERKNLAEASYHILHGIRSIPGTNTNGGIDIDELRRWVTESIKLCADRSRDCPAKRIIGEILANSPQGTDTAWPCEEVRTILDELKDAEIGSGFTIGKENLRGVTTRSAYEGGKQERNLAATFKNDSNSIRIKFPYTAKLLNQLADHYERDAQSEDLQMEWD